MRDFSDIPKIVLILSRIACIFLSGLVALIMAVIYWHKHYVQKLELSAEDTQGLIIMGVVLIACLILAAMMKREIKKM